MAKERYGITKQVKSQFPVRELLVVPHKDRDLTLSFPAFGPGTYRDNTKSMTKIYSRPVTGELISFREPRTFESISAAAYNFVNLAKPEIFDPKWLQLGYIVKTSEGVFTNTDLIDESRLKQLLNDAEKINGIYLINDRIAFAPYDSFKIGVQEVDAFAQGGLARALEHTSEKVASNLRKIGSQNYYKWGVNVWGFEGDKKPVVRVALLESARGIGGDGLHVVGHYWDGYDDGRAFGVLK